jgi:hypothetical protein
MRRSGHITRRRKLELHKNFSRKTWKEETTSDTERKREDNTEMDLKGEGFRMWVQWRGLVGMVMKYQVPKRKGDEHFFDQLSNCQLLMGSVLWSCMVILILKARRPSAGYEDTNILRQ